MVAGPEPSKDPYLDKEGRSMAHGGGSLLLGATRPGRGWAATAFIPLTGKDYLVFHAYEAADKGLQKLKIAGIQWDARQVADSGRPGAR